MGWIKLDRRLQDHWLWFCKPFSKGQAWIDLILLANWEDQERLIGGKVVQVERGCFTTTCGDLSERWGWSKKTVSRFLDLLESETMIRTSRGRFGAVISIENYGEFQDSGCDSDTKMTRSGNRKETEGKRKGNESHTNILKNLRNKELSCSSLERERQIDVQESEGLEVKTASGAGDHPVDCPKTSSVVGFDAFWEAYPRKVGKGAGRKAWEKLRPTKELTRQILQAVERDKCTEQWKRDGGQFIPYPATWLNQQRWEDMPFEEISAAMAETAPLEEFPDPQPPKPDPPLAWKPGMGLLDLID